MSIWRLPQGSNWLSGYTETVKWSNDIVDIVAVVKYGVSEIYSFVIHILILYVVGRCYFATAYFLFYRIFLRLSESETSLPQAYFKFFSEGILVIPRTGEAQFLYYFHGNGNPGYLFQSRHNK